MEDPFDIWGAPVEASTSSRAAGGPYGAINGTKLAAGKQTRSAENDLFSPDTAGWGIASPNVAPATPSTADPRQTFSRIAAIADDAPLQPPSALAAAAALNSSDLITTPPFSSVPTENLVSSPDRRPSPLEKSDLQLSTMTAPTTPDSELAYYHAQNPVALARANAAIHKQVPDLTLPHPLEPPPAFNLEQSPALHSKDAAKGSETWPSFPKEEKDTDGGFDDFDDFDDAQDGTNGGDASGAVADDFGDFDDFDSGEAAQAQAAESTALRAAPAAAAVAQTEASISSARSASATAILGQRALDVRPGSTSSELIPQLRELFAAPFEPDGERYPLYDAAEAQLSKDGIRQVGGLRQVLVTEELCKLYETLSMMPSLAPVGWTRSRTRREHLVSLGVPINLDEILDGGPAGAGRKALPPLALKIDGATKDASGKGPLSDPGGERPGGSLAPGATAPGKSVGGTPRNGSPGPGKKAERRRIELGLGPMPDVNLKRAEEVVALSEEHLTLQALPNLRSLSQEIKQLTTGTSSLLTYYLTLRDAHAADSDTYNAMIRDLVAGATSKFAGGAVSSSGASSKGGDRRATSMVIGSSISANEPNGGGGGTAGGVVGLRKTSSTRSSSAFVGGGSLRGGSGSIKSNSGSGSGGNTPQRSASPAIGAGGKSPLR